MGAPFPRCPVGRSTRNHHPASVEGIAARVNPLVHGCPVATLGPDRLAGLAGELDRVLAPFADDDGIALPMQTWLISARRQPQAG
jgi:hypothetical protein